MKKQLLQIATTLLCLAGCSYAGSVGSAPVQESGAYFHQGDWLVGFDGSYNHLSVKSGGDKASLSLFYANVGASYFITDNISAGLDTLWLYMPKTEDISASAIGLELNAKYHWQIGNSFLPYVGVHAGYAWGKVTVAGNDASKDIKEIGADAGVIVPINKNVYMDFGLRYSDYLGIKSVKLDTIQFMMGLKIKF